MTKLKAKYAIVHGMDFCSTDWQESLAEARKEAEREIESQVAQGAEFPVTIEIVRVVAAATVDLKTQWDDES